METQLLKDPDAFPSNKILEDVLVNIYPVYESFMNTVTGHEYELTYEWSYYKDGKSWLCKVIHKKKTVFWISVWTGYFKVGFYFTEKHLEGISNLDIDEKIKEDFYKMKPVGKLLPMIFDIHEKCQLIDLLKVLDFKKKLK